MEAPFRRGKARLAARDDGVPVLVLRSRDLSIIKANEINETTEMKGPLAAREQFPGVSRY